MKRNRGMTGALVRNGFVILLGLAIVAALPVLIPVVAVMQWRDGRRLRAKARSFACLTCHRNLGDEAVALADKAWGDYMSALHWRPEQGIRRRVVRHIHAVCPHCGTQYQLIDATGTFAKVNGEARAHESRVPIQGTP
jgi:hypothetical protein